MIPYLSIVIPVYNEEGNLRQLTQRVLDSLAALQKPYEIIFINDGSHDRSSEILTEIYNQHSEVIRVIEFNGNFGQHMAIMAGFEHVRGEIIITLDADLQNPPEEIPKLVAKIEEGYDVVGGYRKKRQDHWFRRWASKLNNWIRYSITRIRMTDQGCMLRAYKRHIIELMVASDERTTFIPALAYSFATKPTEIEVEHHARTIGESKYNLYRLLRLNFDLMTGFSLVPLQMVTLFGIVVSLLSTLFFIFLLIRRLVVGPEAEGLFTLFAILFLLLGCVLMALGIIGEYTGRIYQEVRKRPRFVIKRILETSPNEETSH